jgi:hypothetical protein
MVQRQNHEHAGFSWYISTKPEIFNPYNLSDRISRKTWYDNITYPDMARQNITSLPRVKVIITPLCGPHNLFTRLSCPKCNERYH